MKFQTIFSTAIFALFTLFACKNDSKLNQLPTNQNEATTTQKPDWELVRDKLNDEQVEFRLFMEGFDSSEAVEIKPYAVIEGYELSFEAQKEFTLEAQGDSTILVSKPINYWFLRGFLKNGVFEFYLIVKEKDIDDGLALTSKYMEGFKPVTFNFFGKKRMFYLDGRDTEDVKMLEIKRKNKTDKKTTDPLEKGRKLWGPR